MPKVCESSAASTQFNMNKLHDAVFQLTSVYLVFLKIEFLRYLSFHLSNVAGLFTNVFFMMFRAAALNALFVNAALIGGYPLEYMLSYTVLSQVLVMVIPQWGSIGVAEDIRTGQIASDLLKPVNYYFMILSKRVGVGLFYLLMRGLPVLIIGIFLGLFRTQPDFFHISAGIISVFLSIMIANSFHFLVEATAFWLESHQGPKRLISVSSYFFSGAFIPIALFPPWAKEVSSLLPFQYTLNATVNIFLGSSESLQLLGLQTMWLLIMVFLCLMCLNRGVKKISLHGG